jgi:hypothetical protein
VKEGANPDVDEIRKLVSGSLKKALADGSHPDPNLLSAFAENALPEAARKQLLQHLGGCSACREILYLSMPDSEVAQKALSFQPNRFSVFAWRWGAVAASIAVVAVLLVGARHKVAGPSAGQKVVVPSAVPAPAQVATDKLPAELDQMQAAQKEPRTETRVVRKAVPEPKHMSAKPKTEFAFDSSDEVHMLPQAGQNAGQNIVHDYAAAAKSRSDYPVEGPKKATEPSDKDLSRDDRKLTEAVAVSGAAPQVSQQKQTAAESLEKVAASPRAHQSFSGYLPNALGSVVSPQWRLSANGAVQRSLNSGTTWQNVAVAGQTGFRSVSSVGSNVWAGGDAGLLYHSADSGQNWVRVEPAVPGQKLTADITRIEFSDALNGTVSTANSEVWTTADGGHRWQRK